MNTKKQILGIIGEKLVEIELLKRNIAFLEPGENNPYFDLIINTKKGLKRIQIKTSLYDNNFKKKYFQFTLKNRKENYDYLICICMLKKDHTENRFYIIPKKDLISRKGTQLKGINFILAFDEKYKKFENNWDVLKNG